jgi:hypothetical protein
LITNEKNELRLLEAVHRIDDGLVREAMQPDAKPVMHRSRVFTLGTVAAAAVIAVGAAAVQHAKQPTDALRGDPVSSAVQSQADTTEAQAIVTTVTGESTADTPAQTTKPGTPDNTGAPVQTTVTTVQTEASDHTDSAESGISDADTGCFLPECWDYIQLNWNGKEYHGDAQCPFEAFASDFTLDCYLGKISDFETVKTREAALPLVSPDDSVYTVKETGEVLFAMKENGICIYFCTWDYRPEPTDKPRDPYLAFF